MLVKPPVSLSEEKDNTYANIKKTECVISTRLPENSYTIADSTGKEGEPDSVG